MSDAARNVSEIREAALKAGDRVLVEAEFDGGPDEHGFCGVNVYDIDGYGFTLNVDRAKVHPADEVARLSAPIPMVLSCEHCHASHVDRNEWATRPHRTHLCEHCGAKWRPANVATVGVAALSGDEATR